VFTRSRPQPALLEEPAKPTQATVQKSIDELSFSELKAFHEHVGTVLAQRLIQARETFRVDFIDRMSALGLTLDDLRQEKPKKERKPRETKARYQHPDDASLLWSGRGKPPVWMQALLDQGRELEEFAIATEHTPAA